MADIAVEDFFVKPLTREQWSSLNGLFERVSGHLRHSHLWSDTISSTDVDNSTSSTCVFLLVLRSMHDSALWAVTLAQRGYSIRCVHRSTC